MELSGLRDCLRENAPLPHLPRKRVCSIMSATTMISFPMPPPARPRAVAPMPGAGSGAIDALLAAVNPHDRRLVDAVLDLRLELAEPLDAKAGLRAYFHLKELLEGRHPTALARVETLIRQSIFMRVRPSPAEAWHTGEVALDADSLEDAIEQTLAAVTPEHPPARAGEVIFEYSADL
jgi:hypothetical protein